MPRLDSSLPDIAEGTAFAPPDLAARAEALVKRYPECFWTWRPDARVRSFGDVHLVVRHLREYGGHDAWRAARDLHRCLSPLSRRTF